LYTRRAKRFMLEHYNANGLLHTCIRILMTTKLFVFWVVWYFVIIKESRHFWTKKLLKRKCFVLSKRSFLNRRAKKHMKCKISKITKRIVNIQNHCTVFLHYFTYYIYSMIGYQENYPTFFVVSQQEHSNKTKIENGQRHSFVY